jgi:hypothetical protein
VYTWAVTEFGKFKANPEFKSRAYREMHSGKGIQVMLKTFVEPQLSVFELVTPKDKLRTFEPIVIRVRARDRLGDWRLPVFYGLNYQICLTRDVISKQDLIDTYDSGHTLKESGRQGGLGAH